MKILTVVGARPQLVKASAVSRALRARPGWTEVLVHTGQHYDENLSDIFFEELDLPAPHHHLGVGSLPHGAQTGRMLEALERTIQAEKPDRVLVYGDTNSTLAGALAAVKLHVPVAHVEAGLRSWNRAMPEETNRVVVDHVADLLLIPTEQARANLAREGIPAERIRMTGDVMFDVALRFAELAARRSKILERLGLAPRSYVLATFHRAETTDDPSRLRAVVEALADVGREARVVLPLHPRTRAALERAGLLAAATAAALVIEPVGYLDMTTLEKNARLVATDSGGVQKEAFFHEVPCVTLRDETEWTELVELGWNRLAPPRDAASVARTLREALGSGSRGRPGRPYGSGDAAARIVDALQSNAT